MLYLYRLIFSFVFFVFLWISLIFLQLGVSTQSSKWIHEAYGLKNSLAKEVSAEMLVIVSGSNSLFGFDSEALENDLNIPVVNQAVHAGLGLEYILHNSKIILNRGDIVLLPVEYSFYQSEGKPSEVYIDYILSRDKEYFYKLSLVDKIDIVSGVSVSRIAKGLKFYVSPRLEQTKGIYGIQNINSYGDQINVEPDKMTKKEISTISNLTAKEITDSELSDHFINTMDNYISWANDVGVCVIAMPPNYMFFEEYNSIKYSIFLSNIKKYFVDRNIKFLGSPSSYMYDKNLYFNTRYHLNSSGVKLRTLQVIDDIGGEITRHCGNN